MGTGREGGGWGEWASGRCGDDGMQWGVVAGVWEEKRGKKGGKREESGGNCVEPGQKDALFGTRVGACKRQTGEVLKWRKETERERNGQPMGTHTKRALTWDRDVPERK